MNKEWQSGQQWVPPVANNPLYWDRWLRDGRSNSWGIPWWFEVRTVLTDHYNSRLIPQIFLTKHRLGALIDPFVYQWVQIPHQNSSCGWRAFFFENNSWERLIVFSNLLILLVASLILFRTLHFSAFSFYFFRFWMIFKIRAFEYRRWFPTVLKSDINFPSESHLLNVLVQTPKKQATCPIDKQNVFMNTFLDKTRKTTTFLRRCPSFSQF